VVRDDYIDYANCLVGCEDEGAAARARCLSPIAYDLHICNANYSSHIVECMRGGGTIRQCGIAAAQLHSCGFRDRIDQCPPG